MSIEDSKYVGSVVASWSGRYLDVSEDNYEVSSKHQVVASLDKEASFTTQMKMGDHYSIADEPKDFGGHNFGPTPYDLVSGGLSACTAMTLQMYAKRKQWNLQNVEVHTSYSRTHAEDCEHCEDESMKIDTFEREIKLQGDLDEKQTKRLLQIADKCPVHKTLHTTSRVTTKLITK